MMKVSHRLETIFIVGLLIVGAADAQDEDDWTNSRASFICRSSNEVREIKTYIANGAPGASDAGVSCRVDYVKNGSTQTVWSSRTNRSFCDGKASELAARLQSGNFTCKPLHAQRSDKD